MKRAGGRRYYRPADIELLKGIHTLLYSQGYTIRGVQRILKEENTAYVVGIGRGEVMPRKGDAAREGAPPPGTAKVAPRIGSKAVLDAPPKVIHKMSAAQSDALKLALRDLTDARKLLDPSGR